MKKLLASFAALALLASALPAFAEEAAAPKEEKAEMKAEHAVKHHKKAARKAEKKGQEKKAEEAK
jgi:hypothetical protein